MSQSHETGGRFVAFVAFMASFTVFVTTVLVVGLLATGFLDTGARPRLSVTAVFSVVIAAGLVPYALVARAHAGRAPAIAAWVTLGWVPLLATIGDGMLGEAIAPGAVDASASHLPRALAWGMLIAPIASALTAPSLARVVRGGAVLRVALPIAWLLGAALVAGGLARARLPDPDRYVSSLPTTGTIEKGSRGFIGETEVSVGDAATDYSTCYVDVGGRRITGAKLPCGKLFIMRDARNELWFLRPQTSFIWDGRANAALRAGTLDQVAVYARTIPKSLAPPIGWLIGALAGLVLALAPIAAALFFQRRARRLPGQDATHRGDGLVELDDGRTVTLSDAAKLPPGPLRVDHAGPDKSDYRAAPPLPTRTLGPGTLAVVREENEARANGNLLAALVIVTLSCATLLAAATHGIVF